MWWLELECLCCAAKTLGTFKDGLVGTSVILRVLEMGLLVSFSI